MKTLIPNTRITNLGPQFSSPNFLFHFPSLSRKNPHLRSFTHIKWLYLPRTLTFCSATSSDSLSYNGWDDPRLGGGSAQSGESNQLHNLLNSLGLDDRRYIFVYLLGFLCALAVSRIRVSSIVVFPACAILFAVGFSIGFINGGYVNELSLMGTKKRLKDDTFRASIEKLRNSVVLFDGCDSKISNLKNIIRRAIESSHITVSNLENCVEVLESIGLSALNAKSVVETCVDSISIENPEVERLSTQKSSKRKKEVGESGIDLLKFAGNLFQKKSANSKSNKIKEGIMKDSGHLELNDQSRGNILAPSTGDNVVYKDNAEFSGNNYSNNDGFRETAENLENDISFSDVGSGAGRVFRSEKYSYQSNRLKSVNNQRISLKMGPRKEVETWAQYDNFLDSVDFSVDLKRMGNELFEKREQILSKTNASYRPIHSRDSREKEIYETHNEEEERMILDDDPNTVNYSFGQKNDEGSFPSSSVSDDIVFNKYLMEANSLLKEARKFLRVKSDEGHLETLLYDAAKLFSKAIDMKPMSLLAVGQLGNTYLLHGELKLKRSRRLRALLAESDQLSVRKRGKVLEGIDDLVERRDRIASLLICVCEECEELLVEAGRKFRLALSIDGNDMRALYNWGLALSFRAQLIADIGPDAAFDADKVFLAAIDKFDAMMSKSNAYAPDALFRWGAALQQRSRLRPRNKNEKVKLLQQAKRLYEDALDMDSDNLQVREALSSCISELSFRSY